VAVAELEDDEDDAEPEPGFESVPDFESAVDPDLAGSNLDLLSALDPDLPFELDSAVLLARLSVR
jgi:hypothetical protein